MLINSTATPRPIAARARKLNFTRFRARCTVMLELRAPRRSRHPRNYYRRNYYLVPDRHVTRPFITDLLLPLRVVAHPRLSWL